MAFMVTYPVEVQVKARSSSGDVVTLCYLFDKLASQANKFLADAGFSDNKIKNMDASTSNEVTLGNDLSLKDLVEDKSGYVLYEGTSLVGVCEPSLMFVSSEISFMNNLQFGELVATSPMKPTQARPLNMPLYQNFKADFGLSPKEYNQSLPMARFPSSITDAPLMYQPNSLQQIGYIPSKCVPGWLTPNGTILSVSLSPAPPEMKYLAYFYEPLADNTYLPVYITVPKNFYFTTNIQPATVDTFVRTQEQFPNGLRDIIKIPMPVSWTPLDMAMEEEKKKLAAEQKKAEEEAKIRATVKEKIKKIQAAKTVQAVQAVEERKTKDVIFKRICDEWSLESIINRNWNNDDAWNLGGTVKGGTSDLLVCKRWRVVRVNDDGKEVDEDGKPNPQPNNNATNPVNNTSTNTTVPSNSTTPPTPLGPIDKSKCGTYLVIILNQRFSNDRIKDYVMEQCKSWDGQNTPTATALAMVSMHNEVLERRLAGIEDKVLRQLAEADAAMHPLHDRQTELAEQTVLNPTNL